MPIATRVIGNAAMDTAVTLFDVPTQGRRTTALNDTHHPTLATGYRAGVLLLSFFKKLSNHMGAIMYFVQVLPQPRQYFLSIEVKKPILIWSDLMNPDVCIACFGRMCDRRDVSFRVRSAHYLLSDHLFTH